MLYSASVGPLAFLLYTSLDTRHSIYRCVSRGSSRRTSPIVQNTRRGWRSFVTKLVIHILQVSLAGLLVLCLTSPYIESILTQLQVALEPSNVTIQYVKCASKSVPSMTTSTDSTIISDYDLVFYIGSESLSLTNLLMTHAFCDVS